MDDTALLAMVAMGQFMVILIAGIDLSVGAGVALTGMSVALLHQYYPGIPIFVIVLLSILIGFLLGSFNGILVSMLRIPAIIVTLGTLGIYRGFVSLISGGTWVSAHEMSDAFKNLPRGGFLGVSNLLLVAILCVIIFGVYQPDKGEVLIEGKEIEIRSPRASMDLGIETVYQELALVDKLDVVE
ncbi:unnamed protein product, partial [marine sediment metagenome]